ncbi:hypothetical protein L1987_70322 [Smallanthus sonchifolius]|uniref:Uncharacterized protein n=1 Tax=Smallanthus sonchifolius TaxID=185202 RepID=A0ACB9AQK2_9ASTR|nr:hypothetical protein L1987_70322 [Smallanthus sonchifolius]
MKRSRVDMEDPFNHDRLLGVALNKPINIPVNSGTEEGTTDFGNRGMFDLNARAPFDSGSFVGESSQEAVVNGGIEVDPGNSLETEIEDEVGATVRVGAQWEQWGKNSRDMVRASIMKKELMQLPNESSLLELERAWGEGKAAWIRKIKLDHDINFLRCKNRNVKIC